MPQFDKQLYEDIGAIKAHVAKIPQLEAKVDNVQKKVDRMYGWAAGAGAMVTVTLYLAKEAWNKFKGLPL